MVDASYVPLTVKACALAARERASALQRGDATPRRALEYCTLLRRIGVGLYLIGGTPDPMYGWLQKSGRAWLHAVKGADPATRITGAFEPVLDAIAGGALDAVAALSELHAPHRPGREYEEDHLYCSLLQACAGARDTATPERLARLCELAPDDPRTAVCAALLAGDADRLGLAIVAFGSAQAEQLAGMVAAGRIDTDHLATTARVSIEVVAWARLAACRGIALSEALPACPPTARRFHLTPSSTVEWWQIPIGGDLAPAGGGDR